VWKRECLYVSLNCPRFWKVICKKYVWTLLNMLKHFWTCLNTFVNISSESLCLRFKWIYLGWLAVLLLYFCCCFCCCRWYVYEVTNTHGKHLHDQMLLQSVNLKISPETKNVSMRGTNCKTVLIRIGRL